MYFIKNNTYNPQMIKYDGIPRSNKVKNGTLGKLTDEQEKKVIEYKRQRMALSYPSMEISKRLFNE